jgi:hypothetical protein
MAMGVAFYDSDKDKWLASEPDWSSRLGDGWTGTKFLGKGSHGIAGRWEYQGEESRATSMKKVVVKQSEAEDTNWDRIWTLGKKTPYDEGIYLMKLAKLGSNHIIRH